MNHLTFKAWSKNKKRDGKERYFFKIFIIDFLKRIINIMRWESKRLGFGLSLPKMRESKSYPNKKNE